MAHSPVAGGGAQPRHRHRAARRAPARPRGDSTRSPTRIASPHIPSITPRSASSSCAAAGPRSRRAHFARPSLWRAIPWSAASLSSASARHESGLLPRHSPSHRKYAREPLDDRQRDKLRHFVTVQPLDLGLERGEARPRSLDQQQKLPGLLHLPFPTINRLHASFQRLAQAASRRVTTARAIRRASAREPHVTSTTAYSSFCFLRHLHFLRNLHSLRNQGRQPLNFLLSTVALFWSASRGQDTIRRDAKPMAASPIKFGTSGWRGIIADDFTFRQRAPRRRRDRRTRPEPQREAHAAGGARHAISSPRSLRAPPPWCWPSTAWSRCFALGHAHAGGGLRDSPPQNGRRDQFHRQPQSGRISRAEIFRPPTAAPRCRKSPTTSKRAPRACCAHGRASSAFPSPHEQPHSSRSIRVRLSRAARRTGALRRDSRQRRLRRASSTTRCTAAARAISTARSPITASPRTPFAPSATCSSTAPARTSPRENLAPLREAV